MPTCRHRAHARGHTGSRCAASWSMSAPRRRPIAPASPGVADRGGTPPMLERGDALDHEHVAGPARLCASMSASRRPCPARPAHVFLTLWFRTVTAWRRARRAIGRPQRRAGNRARDAELIHRVGHGCGQVAERAKPPSTPDRARDSSLPTPPPSASEQAFRINELDHESFKANRTAEAQAARGACDTHFHVFGAGASPTPPTAAITPAATREEALQVTSTRHRARGWSSSRRARFDHWRRGFIAAKPRGIRRRAVRTGIDRSASRI